MSTAARGLCYSLVATTVAILLLLMLAGCATNPGRGSRLLPWNWFAPDRATQLTTAQADTHQAEQTVVKSAQEDVRAAGVAAAAAPESHAVSVAREFIHRADAKLGQAAGPLTAEQDNTLRALVSDLISENEQLRATGAAELARRDAHDESQSRELEASRATIKDITAKLQASDRRYQAEAETARKWKFWIYGIIIAWIALQVLSGVSKIYPGLAPLSRLAGTVTAPVLQAVNNKLHQGIGEAIAGAQKVSATLADQMREHLDKPLDQDNKDAVKAAFNKASA